MISLISDNIIARLSGNQVLVQKDRNSDNPNELTDEEKRVLKELKNRDHEVRSHESKHMRNPEVLAISGPQYSYAFGPDGKPYAVGGKIMITTGASRDPESALRKAQALKGAALAPGEPSSQDLAAAGSAQTMEMEAVEKMALEEKYRDESVYTRSGNTIKSAVEKYRESSAWSKKSITSGPLSNTQDEDNIINLTA